uniref:GTP-binding protein 10 n=1 Tax=Rhinolophus ferrumequinum TaxID=59479 RepID=B2B981_RHIFE|nr:hypothetical protein [Rhinolophus ferrumequinum]
MPSSRVGSPGYRRGSPRGNGVPFVGGRGARPGAVSCVRCALGERRLLLSGRDERSQEGSDHHRSSQPNRTHPGAGERREAALSHPLRTHLSSSGRRVSAAPRSVLRGSRFTRAALWVPRRPPGALESAPQPEPRSFSCDKVRGQRVGGRAPESPPSPSPETRRQSRPAPLPLPLLPPLLSTWGKGILKLRLHTVLFYPEKNFQIVYGNFIDNLRLFTRGGSGGMGYPRLGGEGGKGGDVWVVAHNKMTLKQLKDKYPKKRFVAGEGANSRVSALKGSKGKDCEIPVPVGISVTDENGKIIGELNKEKDRILVAEGGLGGKLFTNFLPLKGQKRVIHLDLKLIADVGLVGFPNAGKSSLLSQISHAKPEIADYAFTTLKPELGKIMYNDFKQISVADLPGLIEGAHMNKGMGHKFLKHIERTKQLLFVVDISGFQLSSQTQYRTAFETIILLTKELELYKEEVQTKPALLAVNKMDLPDAQNKFRVLMNQLQNPKDFLHLFEKNMIPAQIMEFQHIIPTSAITREGIDELKNCIRTSLDEHANQENDAYHKKQLLNLQISNTVSYREPQSKNALTSSRVDRI